MIKDNNTNMTDYNLLNKQVEALAEDVKWDITLFANVSALLYEAMDKVNWAGFYILKEEELLLGPFQGKAACMCIPVGKGVCGTAVKEKRILRIDDVHPFKGHIACDSASNSEIVLPIYRNDSVFGVLDIDSPIRGRFSEEDEKGLGEIVKSIERIMEYDGLSDRD